MPCWKALTLGFLVERQQVFRVPSAMSISTCIMHVDVFEADSARHVVSMGQLFSRLRTPCGGHSSTYFAVVDWLVKNDSS